MQERLFHNDVLDVPVPKFTAEGMQPTPKTAWELRQEAFEKEWHYGSTTVYWYEETYFFIGDIEHCGMVDISHNALKMRNHMMMHGLKHGHMNYNDPPEYDGVFDKLQFDKAQAIYGYDTYSWDGDEPKII